MFSSYLIFVEVEVVVLLRSPGIQGLSLKTLDLLPLTKNNSTNHFRCSCTNRGATVLSYKEQGCQQEEDFIFYLNPIWGAQFEKHLSNLGPGLNVVHSFIVFLPVPAQEKERSPSSW